MAGRSTRDGNRERFVLFGPLHRFHQAEAGKPCAPVCRDLAHDVGVAAADQDVRDLFVDGGAAGDGGEMGLALGFGDLDKVAVRERIGSSENRAGDLDVVVMRQPADDPGWGAIDGSEPAAELDQRLALDLLDQVAHQLVEQRDVIVGVGIGASQEQIRHLLQNW